jgi:uncharacterized protein (DUF362 family)
VGAREYKRRSAKITMKRITADGSANVVVARVPARYPLAAPFDPDVAYPELGSDTPVSTEPNPAFLGVRECLRLAGLDKGLFGTVDWNPLGCWVQPGMTVLLKPNWVKFRHPRDPEGWRYTVTHGSVIRAVGEYVALALRGRGALIIGDGPQTDSSFEELAAGTGTDSVAGRLSRTGIDVNLVDFRKERWEEQGGVIVARHALPGDPAGYVAFDLGDDSRMAARGGEGRYYGAFYDAGEVNLHHAGGRHEYLISGTAVRADVVINVPKLKTHKKTGVTLSMKNLVGINGDKNWLPHHTEGDPTTGGDQFPGPSLKRSLERIGGRSLRKLATTLPGVGPWLLTRARRYGAGFFGDTDTVVRSGNWHGNDTTWRMALDLNACLLYGQPDGTLRKDRAKTYLSFVDGIIAGEGAGPLNPDPHPAGIVAFGSAPAAVDAACAWLMGFDPENLPIVREAFAPSRLPTSAISSWREVRLTSNHGSWARPLEDVALSECFHFRPHFGWAGSVERGG